MSRADVLERPKRLRYQAADIWDAVAPAALRDKRLTEASRETFTVYCEVRAVADALESLVNNLPVEFTDPIGETIVHPLQVILVDVRLAALEIEKALGIEPFGPAAMAERGGELGTLRDARFNRVDEQDLYDMFGPRVIEGGSDE